MSKKSNVNPDHYKQAGRDRQGENIIHEEERAEWERLEHERRTGHVAGPHIPNQERATTSRPASDEKPKADSADETASRLSDDEGMID